MKKIFLNTILFLSILSCKAQSPVYSLFDDGMGTVLNAYYKDTHNDFNKFEGTWLYTNGNTSLKIVFTKRIMHHDTYFNFYTDMLVGEYEYIENGVLKANTLANLSNTSLNLYDNTFSGRFLVGKYGAPGGNECAIGERRIKLSYKEQDRTYLNQYVVLRQYSDQFGVYIKLIHFSQMSIAPDTGPILGPTLPQGTYILTKQ